MPEHRHRDVAKGRNIRAAVGSAVFAAACGVWIYGALSSPVLDGERARQKAYIDEVLGKSPRQPAPPEAPVAAPSGEPAFARAYWTRYPDVGADPYYGANGELGLPGARAHYNRHGRFEGRRWGLSD